ncbi:MAG: hypothetical protein QM809_14025 [Gordonia sp. (in: high G+C Gram-positive bacteria)]|uniref:hypothetical protein n=1 Tax=Gordonia sp. (in: high G+C Gram-positive bacteria) TaxID=84139 RepID=UPI0039E36FC5
MTAAVVLRRVLCVLAPIEIGLVVAVLAGVAVPGPLRLAVAVLLAATAVVEVAVWASSVRRARRCGLGLRAAAGRAFRELVGERLWGLAAAEVGIFVSLGRLVRRRPDVPAGARSFGGHRELARTVWILVPLTVLETVVFHFLLPWPVVRVVVAVSSVYGLMWVVGSVAGIAMYPHLVHGGVLTVRRGPRTSVSIPLTRIDQVTVDRSDGPGGRPTVDDEDAVLAVALVGETNLTVTLLEPLESGPSVGGPDVRTVRFFADEPHDVVRRLRAEVDGLRSPEAERR